MASTEAPSRRPQFTSEEQSDSLLRSELLTKDVGLNASTAQCLGSSRSHAVAEDGAAVPESFYNGGVAVRAMIVLPVAVAFASGMGGESITPEFLADDLSILDIENQETRTATEVRRDLSAVG
jgi:hypothetical protein